MSLFIIIGRDESERCTYRSFHGVFKTLKLAQAALPSAWKGAKFDGKPNIKEPMAWKQQWGESGFDGYVLNIIELEANKNYSL